MNPLPPLAPPTLEAERAAACLWLRRRFLAFDQLRRECGAADAIPLARPTERPSDR